MPDYDNNQPILSILIPSYEYAEGVKQIIIPLLMERRSDFEVIVHDDSNNDSVESTLAPLVPLFSNLHYVHNIPARGAINNWNELLESASGQYVILIHHDDFPLSEHFASEVIAELKEQSSPDAMLLTCITHDVRRDKLRYGVCNFIRRAVIKIIPSYLLRRNVIGPPSAVVVRRELMQLFDNHLKWLVDVETYYRLFTKSKLKIKSSNLIMVSSTGLPGSITTSINNKKHVITNEELSYISKKYSSDWRLKFLFDKNLFVRLILCGEWLVWVPVKIISSICQNLAGPRVTLEDVHRRKRNSKAISMNGAV